MTENVLVTIKGLQLDSSTDDLMEIINIGQIYNINDKIYVKFDEMLDGQTKLTSNLIKISQDSVEITKKGSVSANMIFTANEKTMTYYNTPFGSLYLSIFARNVEIDKREDSINILIEYSLEANFEQISECKVEICIKPQDSAVKLI